MQHSMYVMRVKTPAESKAPWDYFKLVKTMSEAFGFGMSAGGEISAGVTAGTYDAGLAIMLTWSARSQARDLVENPHDFAPQYRAIVLVGSMADCALQPHFRVAERHLQDRDPIQHLLPNC